MTKLTMVGQDRPPPQTSNFAGELAAPSELKPEKLRIAWRRYDRVAPPEGLSRDMLVRAIAYKIHEHAFGGLSKSTLRRLATLARALDGLEGEICRPTPHSSQEPSLSGTGAERCTRSLFSMMASSTSASVTRPSPRLLRSSALDVMAKPSAQQRAKG